MTETSIIAFSNGRSSFAEGVQLVLNGTVISAMTTKGNEMTGTIVGVPNESLKDANVDFDPTTTPLESYESALTTRRNTIVAIGSGAVVVYRPETLTEALERKFRDDPALAAEIEARAAEARQRIADRSKAANTASPLDL